MLLWMVLVAGCGGDEAVVPSEGSWRYDDALTAFTEDGCGLSSGLVFADAIIDQLDEDGFRFIDTNGDAFTCARGAVDFTCADLTTHTDASGDARLTFVSSASGSFASAEALSRTLTVIGSCDGAGCADLFATVSFPCATTVALAATYEGPAGSIDSGFGAQR